MPFETVPLMAARTQFFKDKILGLFVEGAKVKSIDSALDLGDCRPEVVGKDDFNIHLFNTNYGHNVTINPFQVMFE
jgi:hypothetical protein